MRSSFVPRLPLVCLFLSRLIDVHALRSVFFQLYVPVWRCSFEVRDVDIYVVWTLWWAAIDLDRSNVSNAYVSGMQEELNMHGTEFNVSASPSPIRNST